MKLARVLKLLLHASFLQTGEHCPNPWVHGRFGWSSIRIGGFASGFVKIVHRIILCSTVHPQIFRINAVHWWWNCISVSAHHKVSCKIFRVDTIEEWHNGALASRLSGLLAVEHAGDSIKREFSWLAESSVGAGFLEKSGWSASAKFVV